MLQVSDIKHQSSMYIIIEKHLIKIHLQMVMGTKVYQPVSMFEWFNNIHALPYRKS